MGDNNNHEYNGNVGQLRWSSRLSGRKRRLQIYDDGEGTDEVDSTRDDSKNNVLTLSYGRGCYRPKATSSAWMQDCGILPSE